MFNFRVILHIWNILFFFYKGWEWIRITLTFPVVTQEINACTIFPSQIDPFEVVGWNGIALSPVFFFDKCFNEESDKVIRPTSSLLASSSLANWINLERLPRALTAFALICPEENKTKEKISLHSHTKYKHVDFLFQCVFTCTNMWNYFAKNGIINKQDNFQEGIFVDFYFYLIIIICQM